MKNKLKMTMFEFVDLMHKIQIAEYTKMNEIEFLESLNDAEIIVIIDRCKYLEPMKIKKYAINLIENNYYLIVERVNNMNIPE